MAKWITKDIAESPLPTSLLGNITYGSSGSLLHPSPPRQNPRALHTFATLFITGVLLPPLLLRPIGLQWCPSSLLTPFLQTRQDLILVSTYQFGLWWGPVSVDPLGLPQHHNFLPHRQMAQ